MTRTCPLVVWSRWRLHAEALVGVLVGGGEPAEVVDDPFAPGLLVADVEARGLKGVLEARRD